MSGRVTNAQGQPQAAVLVRIQSLNVGASTAADGMYRLVIPDARIRAGRAVQITASRQGLSLRDSEHRGQASVEDVLSLARGAMGDHPSEHRAGFVRMVQDYARLPRPDAEAAARR